MNIYEQAIRLIENNEDFAFATITSHSGSTPRETGAMMIVKMILLYLVQWEEVV